MTNLNEKEISNVNGGLWEPKTDPSISEHVGQLIPKGRLEASIGKKVIIKLSNTEYEVGKLRDVWGGKEVKNLWGLFGGGDITVQLVGEYGDITFTYRGNLYEYIG